MNPDNLPPTPPPAILSPLAMTLPPMSIMDNVQRWAVYTHHIGDQLEYIGVCKVGELLSAPDARKNSAWRDRLADRKDIRVTIAGTTDDEVKAWNYAAWAIRHYRPTCNVHGVVHHRSIGVRCKEDGREFRTLTEAAEAYGISVGSLSNHINNRKGYEKIHKLTFERI